MPRPSWYVHEHAADAPGHVHTDGTTHRSAEPDDEWTRLFEESVAHHHRHGAGQHHHEHGGHHGHGEPRSDATARAADAGPAFVSTDASSDAHAHWQSPFQPSEAARYATLDARTVAPAPQPADAERAPAASPLRLCARAPPRVPTV
ncbi:MAG TPA: hypothetical protein VIS07_03235 [Candidatus Binatia bacterium]